MTPIPSRLDRASARAGVAALALSVALVAAACGSSGTPTSSAAQPSVEPSAAPATPARTPPPEPTAVPGGPTVTPDPLPDDTTTTETDWGTILDAVPATFPVFPDAEPVEAPEGPVSGAWIAGSGPDEVAGWYRETLADLFAVIDVSSPLEDGSRVLDAWADIPECRIQAAFRPAGESTMITVLYGAGCADGDG